MLMTTVNRDHTAFLAAHLAANGLRVVDHGIQTDAGLLAIVIAQPNAWIFGHLRIAAASKGFAPPIGAYSDAARQAVRDQATAWFNDQGLIPELGVPIQVDAFGVLLADDGAPTTVHHVPSAY